MAADPKQVLRILDYRGIDLRLDGDRLIARPRSGQLPDDMARFIRHFKDLIVAELTPDHGGMDLHRTRGP
jgi:hypothetical protein